MTANVELIEGLERGQLQDNSKSCFWTVRDDGVLNRIPTPVFSFATPDTVLGEELQKIMTMTGKTLNFLQPAADPDAALNGEPFYDQLWNCGTPTSETVVFAKATNTASLAFNIAAHYYPATFKWVERD